MRSQLRSPARLGQAILVAIGLATAIASIAWVHPGAASRVSIQSAAGLASTIFSYDGKDFVRTQTTLMAENGKSAEGTKLDQNTPAYKALVQKQAYRGDVTVFGKKYDGHYAPVVGSDGKLTGALFVGVPK
jgi:hypothetical protein